MSTPNEAGRDLREQLGSTFAFLRRALRFWFAVPVVLAVAGLACFAFLRLRQPAFRSETVVLYSQGNTPGEAQDQAAGPRNVTVRMKELLMSRPKLEKVVVEFDLYGDERRELGMAEAVDELRRHMDFRAPGGDTFSIAFVGSSPVEAQRVTARLARLVIEQDSELRSKQAVVSRDFLIAEKAKTETSLRTVERELAAFMAKHPRFALDTTPLTQGAAIRATTAAGGPAAVPAPASRTGVGGSLAQASGASRSAPAPLSPARSFDADSEVSRATASVAAARAHLAEELERYTPAHPDARAATAALERAEGRLAELVSGVPPSTPTAPAPATEPPAAPPAQPSIARAMTRAPVRPAPAPVATTPHDREVVTLETEWLKFTSAVTEARQRQDQVEAALFKADILASSESSGHGLQMTVIDPAYVPVQPLPPSRVLIVAMFLGVGLALGLAIMLVLAVVDDRIFDARDASAGTELLVLVPRPDRRVHVPS